MGKFAELRGRDIGAHRTGGNRRSEQGSSFGFVNEIQQRQRYFLSLAFEIDYLTGDQVPATGSNRQFLNDVAERIARPARDQGQQFKSEGQQGVTCEHGNSFSEDFM